jgi:hypothetical protein
MNKNDNEIIQAYFFSKELFNDDDIIKWLIENKLPTIQKISSHKFYKKIKLCSLKKLKLEGYDIIFKDYKTGIKINLAVKRPIRSSFVEFN